MIAKAAQEAHSREETSRSKLAGANAEGATILLCFVLWLCQFVGLGRHDVAADAG